MIDLPNIQYQEITYLFGTVITALAVFWGINKAVIMSKES